MFRTHMKTETAPWVDFRKAALQLTAVSSVDSTHGGDLTTP